MSGPMSDEVKLQVTEYRLGLNLDALERSLELLVRWLETEIFHVLNFSLNL